MAAINTPLSPDIAVELYNLIGEGPCATYESNLTLNVLTPARIASTRSDVVQRDTDDTEDSEEEFEEEEDDDDDLDDEDDFDPDEEDVDEDEELGVAMLQTAGSTSLRGPVVNGSKSEESGLEEDDDEGDKSLLEDEYVIESGKNWTDSADLPETDRAIDSALRMRALATMAAECAASV